MYNFAFAKALANLRKNFFTFVECCQKINKNPI